MFYAELPFVFLKSYSFPFRFLSLSLSITLSAFFFSVMCDVLIETIYPKVKTTPPYVLVFISFPRLRCVSVLQDIQHI